MRATFAAIVIVVAGWRDLGDDSSRLGAALQTFDPGAEWTPIAPEG
jgi:hypothetical protein